MIYLDYAATTPMDKQALAVYQQTATNFYGNTNSLHDVGNKAKEVLDYCRTSLGTLLHTSPNEIYFTSSGTAANQLAIQTLIQANKQKGKHIITTPFEHPSISKYLDKLAEEEDYQISYLKPNEYGEIHLKDVQDTIRTDTCVVIIQHVNPEIGTIQPIEDIGAWLQTQGIRFHSDGVQAFGKIPTNVKLLHVDSYAVCSHKVYGPKGAGALFLKKNMVANNQYDVLESATIDVPSIAAFTTAASLAINASTSELDRLRNLRIFFVNELLKRKLPLQVFTSPNQLPHIIGILFDEMAGDYAMLSFNQNGVYLSTGSACTVGNQEPARTITALQVPKEKAKNYIRLSLGNATTKKDLEKTIEICENILNKWKT